MKRTIIKYYCDVTGKEITDVHDHYKVIAVNDLESTKEGKEISDDMMKDVSGEALAMMNDYSHLKELYNSMISEAESNLESLKKSYNEEVEGYRKIIDDLKKSNDELLSRIDSLEKCKYAESEIDKNDSIGNDDVRISEEIKKDYKEDTFVLSDDQNIDDLIPVDYDMKYITAKNGMKISEEELIKILGKEPDFDIIKAIEYYSQGMNYDVMGPLLQTKRGRIYPEISKLIQLGIIDKRPYPKKGKKNETGKKTDS